MLYDFFHLAYDNPTKVVSYLAISDFSLDSLFTKFYLFEFVDKNIVLDENSSAEFHNETFVQLRYEPQTQNQK